MVYHIASREQLARPTDNIVGFQPGDKFHETRAADPEGDPFMSCGNSRTLGFASEECHFGGLPLLEIIRGPFSSSAQNSNSVMIS